MLLLWHLCQVVSDDDFLCTVLLMSLDHVLSSWNIADVWRMNEWMKRQIPILPLTGHFYPPYVPPKCLQLLDGVFARTAEKISKKSFGWEYSRWAVKCLWKASLHTERFIMGNMLEEGPKTTAVELKYPALGQVYPHIAFFKQKITLWGTPPISTTQE